MLFFSSLIKDTITIILALVLTITMWRAFDSLVIIYSYLRLRITRDKNTKAFLVAKIKDKTLLSQLFSQFKELLLDLCFLLPLILVVLLLSRVKSLFKRLLKLYNKKKQREEV